MSMLDSFFNKGFKAAKCKTLLKLTIPRIKLLRNRREIQIKNMRRDIAKLLETGQEATARIRVEHIIREEKMMAAQEIIELFCELIAVRLPIIETQRECPLDLKEAISSVCFAAPRCADLPELQQVQMAFAGKYGKEFIAAAAELMPECGVNRQLIELLSVRAPDADVKLKLLKEIAEEHELDWDPAASETELLKSHEDLLNGPTKLPLPKEKHDDAESAQASKEESDSDDDFETIDFPDVPSGSVRPNFGTVSAPEMLPFPEDNLESPEGSVSNQTLPHENLASQKSMENENVFAPPDIREATPTESKQFLPFTSLPSESLATSPARQSQREPSPPSPPAVRRQQQQQQEQSPPPLFSETSSVWRQQHQYQHEPFPSSAAPFSGRQPSLPPSRTSRSDANVDFQDVLAAAQQAADSAERAAAAARSAASLAQMRINELVRNKSDEEEVSENPFSSAEDTKPQLFHQDSSEFPSVHQSNNENEFAGKKAVFQSYDEPEAEFDSSHDSGHRPPQRLASMDDETYLSYPNLFSRQDSNPAGCTSVHSDNSRSSQ